MRRAARAGLALAAILAGRMPARAAPPPGLAVAGVLGNSGEEGATLIRAAPRGAGGVVLDASGTLWLGGGDAINRVTLEGRLIERFPITLAAGEHVAGMGFAAVDETLYFACVDERGVENLFALPMRAGATAARLPLALPPRRIGHLRVAAEPLDGKLVFGLEEKDHPAEVAVYFYAPGSRALTRAFSAPLAAVYGVAVDAGARWIYVGDGRNATIVDPEGRPVSSTFPAPVPQLGAVPTGFTGAASLADGAVWRGGLNGFVMRLDRLTRNAPGVVARWEAGLGELRQVVGVGRGLLAFAPDEPADVYLGRWSPGGVQLSLFRRIGALPALAAVGLSDDGWVTVGDEVQGSHYPVQHWWRWEDDARAAPVFSSSTAAVTGGVFIPGSDMFLAADRLGRLLFFRHQGEARGTLPSLPPAARPAAFAYQTLPAERAGRLLFSDRAAKAIFTIAYDGAGLHTAGDRWQTLTVSGATLDEPGDIAALTDGRLVVADRGRVVFLEPSGTGYRLAAEHRGWGRGADDQLGAHVRFAIDGPSLLISDTDRHRVVWLDWTRWTKLGQLGVTDHAGDDLGHVDRPASIALRAGRAVVADTGNQRVLRLTVGGSVAGRAPGAALPPEQVAKLRLRVAVADPALKEHVDTAVGHVGHDGFGADVARVNARWFSHHHEMLIEERGR